MPDEDADRNWISPRTFQDILARHAAWHRSQAKLSWTEKLRLAEAALPSLQALREQWPIPPRPPAENPAPPPPSGCEDPDHP